MICEDVETSVDSVKTEKLLTISAEQGSVFSDVCLFVCQQI